MGFLEKVYEKSPGPVQSLMAIAYGHALRRQRYGEIYQRELEFLQHSDLEPKEVLRSIQQDRLKELVSHAIQFVPYYRDLAHRRGFRATDVDLETLPELFPILERDEVRSEPGRFISTAFSSRETTVASTSGTTGSPLQIVRSKVAVQRNYAFFSRFLAWHGLSPFSRSATFGGRALVSSARKSPPFWRPNPGLKDLRFSSYHISSETIPAYLQELARFQPEFIDAYPSAISSLAKGLLATGQPSPIHPVAVITSSETLLPEQRAAIEQAFRCPVADQYGSVELAMFVGQCPRGTYHAAPEYGVLEFVREDEPDEDNLASVIATGFLNFAMPLIRYRIGDLVEVGEQAPCACGRASQTMKAVAGRLDDVIVTPDGRAIGRLSPVFKAAREIVESQIVQTALDHVEIQAVPIQGCGPDPARPIVNALRARLPESMSISIRLVPAIERSRNGKLRTVVSKIR